MPSDEDRDEARASAMPKPPLNFLQDHYNHMRKAGDPKNAAMDHVEYLITNDLSEERAAGLKSVYEQFYAG